MAVSIGDMKLFDDEYEAESYGWYVSNTETEMSLDEMWDGHEILGNIHDNPELLEV